MTDGYNTRISQPDLGAKECMSRPWSRGSSAGATKESSSRGIGEMTGQKLTLMVIGPARVVLGSLGVPYACAPSLGDKER